MPSGAKVTVPADGVPGPAGEGSSKRVAVRRLSDRVGYTVTIICDRSKSVAIRPKCGFLRITGLYRINNKTCGLLHLQDSLEFSESTAKLGVNTLIKIIYNMHIHLV